jgi:redox-sensitive bicupin YhaK (pirin superfamily)
MTLDPRRAATRFHTELDWLDSWHSFSFGPWRDPDNTHHGLLLVNNDDVVRGGGGFGTHPHADMEIVTWVLRGEIEHRDSEGNEGIIYPGLAQRMTAGTGIRHSETNASATADVHLVQMWVFPDTPGLPPGYEQRDLSDAIDGGGLVAVASGQDDDGAVRLHQREAKLLVGRLREGERTEVPASAHAHVFAAVGGVQVEAEGATVALATGDALRATETGAFTLTAGDEGGEVLVWLTA